MGWIHILLWMFFYLDVARSVNSSDSKMVACCSPDANLVWNRLFLCSRGLLFNEDSLIDISDEILHVSRYHVLYIEGKSV